MGGEVYVECLHVSKFGLPVLMFKVLKHANKNLFRRHKFTF